MRQRFTYKRPLGKVQIKLGPFRASQRPFLLYALFESIYVAYLH
jgi:hypothetical protein